MRTTLACLLSGVVGVVGVVGVGAGVGASPATAAARHFKSCTAMHAVYKHGVGLPKAHDLNLHHKPVVHPVTGFVHNRALYLANNGPRNVKTGEYDLDRDNDGIACEAH